MSLLDVTGLTISTHDGRTRDGRTHDGRTLVSDLSFSIDPGTRLGLIGESGSGKSLTALAVMGLLPPGMTASGSVVLDVPGLPRTEVVGATEKQLVGLRGRAAAVVFQEPLTALDPLMRVGRQIAEPLRRRQGLRGAALRRAVGDALDQVRLPERVARAHPHEISGGQRQRVAIAMALACEPALLIADEPTTALDVTVQSEVLALLDGLVSERGMALLFVSHDLAVVSGVTDRVVVLKDGEAVESGGVDQILHAPRHPYTRNLVASARHLESALERTIR
ncbi:ATP-binding cassette domain-containing protein [Peterkaempfera bronchialis]|uniref:ABC transporter ATP-binding protein n=1 Tax=Peterkaempfera bronchialis TaxID=2126346 RepID=A0A345SVX2_9ACTN|nr:ABC transporter ATP-binding protein [Peterkaempfera bronchialis]AXI77877.1 ABC transporter ATP-binding protein [Peterkaempfera bronchialis]